MTIRLNSCNTIFRKILLAAILFLCTQLIFPQEYFFRNYSVKDGMPQSSAYCLMQDSRGFIWVGTPGAGASVFDGISFKTYTKKDGLSGNIVRSIFEDSSGNIWFGTDNGVTVYNGYSMKIIGTEEGLECSFATRFAESKMGVIWIATNDGGLYGVETGDSLSLRNYNQNNGLISNFIYDIFVDSNDRVWLGLYGGLNILSFTDENCNTLGSVYSPVIQAEFVTAIEQKSENTFLIGTYGDGMLRITEDSLPGSYKADYPFHDEFLSGIISWDILLKEDGELLVATDKKGIISINDFVFSNSFDTDNGLVSNQVLDLIEDNEGNIWYATMGQGISMYDDKTFIRYRSDDGIKGKEINGILFVNDLLIIASSEGVLSFKIDGDKLVAENIYNSEDVLSGTSTNSLIFFNNQIWVGTNNGIKIVESGKVSNYYLNDKLNSLKINCLLKDSDENIWIGTNTGYNKIVANSVYSLNEDEGFIHNEVQTIIEDSKGRIWMGTLGGLVMIDKDIYTDYIDEDGLSELSVNSLAEDERGNIWIGTFGGGLFKFNINKKDKPIDIVANKGILSSNNIYTLLFLDNKTIIAGTDLGFDIIKLNDEQNVISSTNYNMYDGYSEGENNLNSLAVDRSGNVWFGTSDGLVKFDPHVDKDSMLKPSIVLTNIRLFFDEVNWESRGFKSQKWFNIPENLVLNHKDNHVTFDFTGFCFHDPLDLEFSYYLEGQSKEWSPYDKSNEVVFTGLSPGTYSFKVRAKNEYRTESDIVEYNFIIKPPIWKTTWFILAAAILVLFVIIVVIRLREKALVVEKIKLENIVKERTHEVVKQKNEITEQRDILASQKHEITSSIEYAERIQVAVLPDERILKKAFPEFFILFKPKDIVSGDFYWMSEKDGHTVFTACDCTGHGVPGAFMSLLGVSFLNKIVNESGEVQPAKILECLRENIISSLKQKGLDNSSKDGMDIAFCSIPKNRKKLFFAGANNPVYIIRKHPDDFELIEIRGDRMPVGFHPEMTDFTQHEVDLVKGDAIYMFSDGYVDQFGGEHSKKFMAKRFKKLLLDNQDKSMKEQKEILIKVLDDWMNYGISGKQSIGQIDDIIVMGIRI